ncbi:hypothetical protein [Enterococcus innesii]|uniref:hypothetical protein n=1 Tax=Enterococcus innesii TaxID=2839759 RepID=UPI002DB62DBD|nr:hypothetical protein [Enterococcus innesii]MEB5953185.1 hypothetical protein [Enterococcus innesii]
MKIKRSELEYIRSLVFNDLQEQISDVQIRLGISETVEYSFDSFMDTLGESSKTINDDEEIEEIMEDMRRIEDTLEVYNKLDISRK